MTKQQEQSEKIIKSETLETGVSTPDAPSTTKPTPTTPDAPSTTTPAPPTPETETTTPALELISETLETLAHTKKTRFRSPFFSLGEGSPEEIGAQILERKRKRLWIFSAFILLTTLALSLFFFWWNAPLQAIRRHLSHQQLGKAIAVYEEKLSDKDAPEERQLITAAIDDEIDALFIKYNRAALSTEAFTKTISDYEKAAYYTNKEKAQTTLETVQEIETSRLAYQKGIALNKEEKYQEAMKALEKVIEIDANYEQAQIQLDLAKDSFTKDSLSKVDDLIRLKNFSAAEAQLAQAQKILPLSQSFKDKKYELYQAKEANALASYLKEASDLADVGSYLEAIEQLRSDQDMARKSEVRKAIEIYSNQYVTRAMRWADEAVNKDQYDEAIEILENAKWNVYDEALDSMLKEVNAIRPSVFTELTASSNTLYNTGAFTVKSSTGGNYSSEHMAKFSSTQGLGGQNLAYVSYRLNGNFKRFEGTLIVPKEFVSLASTNLVMMDENNKILYTSPPLSKATGSVSFTVDVEGVENLTLRQNITDILPIEHPIYLSDGIFYKR